MPPILQPLTQVSPDSTITISLVVLLIGAVYALGQYVGSSRTKSASVMRRLDIVEEKIDDIFTYITTGHIAPTRKKKDGNLMTL